MHLSDEEFKKKYTGLKLKKNSTSENNKNNYFKNRFTKHKKNIRKIAESIDWRGEKDLNPIREQKNCGACWAFASIYALESLNFIKNKVL